MNTLDKAAILAQSLPYIKHYAHKVIVIKYGGSAMVDETLKLNVLKDVMLLQAIGIQTILVHGGGSEITTHLQGKSTFIDGLRVTDEATMEMTQMVLAGKINKDLVKMVDILGGKAIGLCGLDGGMVRAKTIERQELGLVGDIEAINPTILYDCLNLGYIPIVATLGFNQAGQSLNINGDDSASAIAAAMQAENLIFLSDIPGVLRDKDDPSSLISHLNLKEVETLKQQGIVSGGMIPKVDCCASAITHGVKRSVILDGRLPHAILVEILSESGLGTLFTQE